MRGLVGVICLLIWLSGCTVAPLTPRPAHWAEPLHHSQLDNCHRVTETLYRCGQLDEQGMQVLASFGVKEILSLREFHTDQGIAPSNIVLHRIKMNAASVTEAQLIEALRIIQQSRSPIMVHCWHGSDRTGTVIAAYRIIVQGWSKQDAIAEMTRGGYGYHSIYANLITTLENIDVAAARQSLGLAISH